MAVAGISCSSPQTSLLIAEAHCSLLAYDAPVARSLDGRWQKIATWSEAALIVSYHQLATISSSGISKNCTRKSHDASSDGGLIVSPPVQSGVRIG